MSDADLDRDARALIEGKPGIYGERVVARAEEIMLAGVEGVYTDRQLADKSRHESTMTDLGAEADIIEWDADAWLAMARTRYYRKAIPCLAAELKDPRERRVLLARARGETQERVAAREISHDKQLTRQRISQIEHAAFAKLADFCALYEDGPSSDSFAWMIREQARSVYHRPSRVWRRRGTDEQLAQSVRRDRGYRFLLFGDLGDEWKR